MRLCANAAKKRGLALGLGGALVLTLGLSACSDSDDSSRAGGGEPSSAVSAHRSPEVTGTPDDVVVEDALVANLKADSEQLMSVSETFLAKGNVSETTKAIARDANEILQRQRTELSGVDAGTSLVDQAEAERVKSSSGAESDIAYLSLLEANMGRLADAWNGLKTSANPTYAKVAKNTADQLAELKARVDKRLQY